MLMFVTFALTVALGIVVECIRRKCSPKVEKTESFDTRRSHSVISVAKEAGCQTPTESQIPESMWWGTAHSASGFFDDVAIEMTQGQSDKFKLSKKDADIELIL